MKEKLKKRLMLAVDIFNWTVFSVFALALLYYGNWMFVSDKFIIPSDSMSPTLIPGDRVVVNKLIFGARIYKNLDFSDGQPLVSWRMPGLRKIRPNDVLVFNFPHGYDDWGKIAFKINYIYGKRCIGAPGDTISIERGFYKNNNYDGIIGVEAEQHGLASMPDSLFHIHAFNAWYWGNGWTIKDFGPLYVPACGDTIRLDHRSVHIYKPAIEYETGKTLTVGDEGVLLGDSIVTEYVFESNYYFVGGDNVVNSQDSRYWGFVPEEFIVGVAKRIAYFRDYDTKKFRWKRIWRRIDN